MNESTTQTSNQASNSLEPNMNKSSLYERWRKFRTEEEKLYEEVVAREGRLQVGPSSKDGLYIRDIRENGVSLGSITKEEAIFIIERLKLIYGI